MAMLKVNSYSLFFYLVIAFLQGYAQDAPQVNVVGNQLYCGEAPMPIVTDISISSGTGSLDVAYIQITTGYSFGSDILVLTGDHPNISTSWSFQTGLLTLTGPASFDDFENAIRDVRFQTIESNFTQDKFFSINLGVANYLPATGHYYLYVQDVGITWTDAKNAAAASSYFGLQGYLATITTPEEVQLTGEQAAGTGWIGGTDRAQEGVWRWDAGPEAGQVFWNGAVGGSSPDGMFAFWNTGEPNNLGDEDYAHITDPNVGILGSWNDLAVTGSTDPTSAYHPKGYIVEFGGMDGDPEINVSGSTVIIMPKTEIVANNACDDGVVQINLTTNADEVFWYETESATAVLHTGLNYEQFIDTDTTFYILPVFNGCNDGNRIPITVNAFNSPIANDITIIQCDDEVADGVSNFNLNNYTDDVVRDEAGDVEPTWQISFFEDAALTIPINGDSYENTQNFQVIYARVFDEFSGCVSSSQVTLQVNSSNGVSASLEVCDDFIEDGFVFFDLTQADSQILENAPVNAALSYYRTYNEALLLVNAITEPYFNEVAYSQTVYARVDIDDVCYAINEVYLTVKDLPNVTQYEEVYYCLNTFPETMTLGGGIIGDIPNNYAYEWSTGETTINIEINETGTYEVFVTRPAGCTNRRTIRVFPSSTALIETIEINDVSENNTITVLVSGDGDYVYALNNENGSYQASNVFENVPAGIHTIYVRDIKAECGIVSEEVSVLGFPKFFTPNGDTVNDTWQIKGFSSRFPNTASVKVFDRYGKLMTVLNAENPSWDGQYNGHLQPNDDYWFLAELVDGRTFKGHFSLKR
ncbi:T9SS type B sorting domain-containing protein [Winogradskyella sp.]|uniref:T9SS type B sorting domain-containing protein n=1 Tax=Winogradskyella sp. TaxID=1883156 RepID=UPI003BA8860F